MFVRIVHAKYVRKREMKNFSTRWRKRWGLNQKQAGDSLGVSDRTIRTYEKEGVPTMAQLAMLYRTVEWKLYPNRINKWL